MRENGLWIWGRHPVLESLRSGSARTVLIAEGRKPAPILDDIRKAAAAANVPVRHVPAGQIDRLAPGQSTQGVAAEVIERRLDDIGALLDLVKHRAEPAFLLILDQLQDPHNVGALLRTADAAGVQGIVIPERRSAPISGTVARVSAGAVSHLPIVEATNLARTLREIRDAGIWIAGLDGEARQSIFEADLRVPIAIVVGSEGEGLRRLTRAHCDFLLRIPMFGAIESLNASVAGSIVLYEVTRQRLVAGGPGDPA